ncbi:hypothetical protein EVAR_99339_1 [Eumeta japonica]|uniref:Uncharacterized protein n=1 Tax=Eumeta variegata TaxID=151549 RepID=A0A4C1T0E7_EUMVA|nr:hypothetical protein EVAR_99339_1 [Eumeta japonica]
MLRKVDDRRRPWTLAIPEKSPVFRSRLGIGYLKEDRSMKLSGAMEWGGSRNSIHWTKSKKSCHLTSRCALRLCGAAIRYGVGGGACPIGRGLHRHCISTHQSVKRFMPSACARTRRRACAPVPPDAVKPALTRRRTVAGCGRVLHTLLRKETPRAARDLLNFHPVRARV